MTREIKLRYWNGVSNQMVYEPEIRSDYKFSLNEYLNTDRGWVWMQFTGLHDKNGKEIYEGDIIKLEQWQPKIYKIDFDRGAFYIAKKESREEVGDIKYAEDSEVIGNIYQNKDLIN